MCVCVDFSTRFGWMVSFCHCSLQRKGRGPVGWSSQDGGFSFLSIIWFVSFGFLLSSHTQTTFSFTDKHTNGRALRARTIGKANVAVVGGAFCAE